MLSVLMPTFNPSLPWLRQALESVRVQNFSDYELVLVNDGSTKVAAGEIGALADAILGKRVRYFNQPSNQGFNRTVNFALAQAQGAYAVVLGDDDYFVNPGYFRDVVALMDAHPQATGAVADYILRREEMDLETPVRLFSKAAAVAVFDGLALFWERFWLPATPALGWGSYVFRVQFARDAGGFVEPVGDMRLFLNLLQQGQLVYVPTVMSCYRYRQGNTSSRGNVDVLRASLKNVAVVSDEAFTRACAIRPLDSGEKQRRLRIMQGACRVHAGRNLRYFRSLGRVTFRQALDLYPLVFTAYSFQGLVQSLACLAALFVPPLVLRRLRTVVVGLREARGSTNRFR